MQGRVKSEKGMLVIEATFVYPIMFFIIFFLIYTGNIFFQKARIESVISQGAILGGAYFSDPLLDDIYSNGATFPGNISIEPYHHLNVFTGGPLGDDYKETLSGDGFFNGMSATNIEIDADGKNNIIYATYTVEVEYEIKFPIKFIFSDNYTSLILSARLEVPSTDTAEFIRNIDMVVDYMDQSKSLDEFSKKIATGFNDLSEFLK